MTEATGVAIPIHDRIPVLISGVNADRYLAGGSEELSFGPVDPAVEDAENPLKRIKPTPPAPEQGDLFG